MSTVGMIFLGFYVFIGVVAGAAWLGKKLSDFNIKLNNKIWS